LTTITADTKTVIASIRRQLGAALARLAAERAAEHRQQMADIDYHAGRAEAAIFEYETEDDIIEAEFVEAAQPRLPAIREIDRCGGVRPPGAIGPGPWVYPGASLEAAPAPRTWLETDSESMADFVAGTGRYG